MTRRGGASRTAGRGRPALGYHGEAPEEGGLTPREARTGGVP